MAMVRQKARLDWLVEIGGASALGLGGGYAALKLAPSFAIAGPAATTGAGLAFFALGMVVMRAASAGRPSYALADFAVAPIGGDELLLTEVVEDELLLTDAIDDELLLTEVVAEVLLLTDVVSDELLLDTPWENPAEDVVLRLEQVLAEPDPQSRVVRLFAQPSMPILEAQASQGDAAKELYEALHKLRRSLR